MKFNFGNCLIEHDEINLIWEIQFKGKRVGDFEFKEDWQGKVWVWNLALSEDHQKKGIGSAIIRKAVAYYGAVYFFTGTRLELKKSEWDYDSRYLTEEGWALLHSCLRKKIIKNEWALNPYRETMEPKDD